MKKLLLTILTLGITIFFTACSSKSQNDVLNSSKQDVSDLLSQLIEKEKEINKLTKQLEACKEKSK
ncbi:hypothetical protein [Arcobacter roscoffensis]|uniref:Lipoprotein n=1 Tax=Arcobacter roscoffensis TaxID=2961520 RepID=A0ABY5E7E8_9BACT|nr:hypothetical protein [Arcobacter roscoffensis]UTJ06638.1 hypothetical protein NJU99_00680 [Arcobacter roscoffensis]